MPNHVLKTNQEFVEVLQKNHEKISIKKLKDD